MIKEALEAGVPGMQDAATNFMKQQITNMYAVKASTLPAHES
jgi:hypothetical protein